MFRPYKQVDNHDIREGLIANSATIAIGDAIVSDTTNTKAIVGNGTGTGDILGVVLSIVGKNGTIDDNTQGSSITVAANNETVAQYKVYFLPAREDIEYVADLDDDAGTTAGSDGVGSFNLASSGTLDESSYVQTSAGGYPETFNSYGLNNPNVLTQVVGHFKKAV